ncbi:FecCD family ABC transporter permease [Xaviernesmea oryzae]|uniref:Iron complex transport system permease protein n=1 Tax=Xaviernesmea oryzae TaxID=464029 RepID=A0A1X7DCK8_9HYPH|nr:iron ABC transporter permease [Xaviernesmea oryzae]SMF12422.1 iron complex transport system permease protein [Xaviernesmea oryzae]
MSSTQTDPYLADAVSGEPGSSRRRRDRYAYQNGAIVLGIAAVIVTALVGIQIGTSGATLGHVLGTFYAKITATPPTERAALQIQNIIWELRVPRIALAILGGAALAIAGTLFQGLLRNPLVSPYTLGIAPAAAFGASLAIVVFGATAGSANIPLVIGALLFSFLNTALVLSLASARNLNATTLILVGIALSQLFGALTACIQYFAQDEVLAAIVRWTWGSVNNSAWYQVLVMFALLALTLPYIRFRSGALNAIAFAGDDSAKSLGVAVSRVRLESIAIAATLTAVTIAFTGIIGFVGLVAPHIARLVVGPNHRFLITFSAIIGALLLVVSDAVGRLVISPGVIPVGIIDALVGAPIFLYLILTRQKAIE